MAPRKGFLSSVKVVYRKSSALMKIVIAVTIALSVAALLTVHIAIDSANQRTEALRQQAQQLEQESQRLQSYAAEKDTIDEIIRIAQERLGLVPPDSIIIQPE